MDNLGEQRAFRRITITRAVRCGVANGDGRKRYTTCSRGVLHNGVLLSGFAPFQRLPAHAKLYLAYQSVPLQQPSRQRNTRGPSLLRE